MEIFTIGHDLGSIPHQHDAINIHVLRRRTVEKLAINP
jgi:hypothetical protein